VLKKVQFECVCVGNEWVKLHSNVWILMYCKCTELYGKFNVSATVYEITCMLISFYCGLMLCSHAMENRIVSTCELVFTSVLRSSAFVVVMW